MRLISCSTLRALAIGRGYARLLPQPGERDGRHAHPAVLRDSLQRVEQFDVARRLEQLEGSAGARRVDRRALAVLAGEEPALQRAVGQLDDVELLQRRHEARLDVAVHEAVAVLRDGEGLDAVSLGHVDGGVQAVGAEVARADAAHEAFRDEFAERHNDVVLRHLGVVAVGVVEVDVVGLQALERLVQRRPHVRRREAGPIRLGEDLRRDAHALAHAGACAQPGTDDALRLSTRVTVDPHRVRVGRVDRRAARLDEGVEHREARRLVGRPPEDVASQHERAEIRGCGRSHPARLSTRA